MTLRLDRWAGPVGRIQRATGTQSKRVFREINAVVSYLIRHGRWEPLKDVRDGRIKPIDLLQMQRARDVRAEDRSESVIYVVRASPSGNIKIGISDRLSRRLCQLRSANFEELKLVYAFPGTGAEERRFHTYLRRHRIRGEWFRPSEAVLQWIEEHRPAESVAWSPPPPRKPGWIERLDLLDPDPRGWDTPHLNALVSENPSSVRHASRAGGTS